MKWWWVVSFDTPTEFLGCVYVEAPHDLGAFLRCVELDLNPGGRADVSGPIPREVMDARDPESEYRYRLLDPFNPSKGAAS